jgi:nitrite reductase (NO-forming)
MRDVDERSPATGFLLAGVSALVAAAFLAVAAQWWHWSWAGLAALHLALIGGVSQLLLGAAQAFAASLLATAPTGRRVLAVQRVAWTVGTALVVLGMATTWHAASYAGAALLATALAVFAAGLRAMQRRSLQRPAWTVRWYYACVIFLAAGGALGLQLARGAPWGRGDLLSAHVTLTVLGWLGTAIVGSLHTFFPTLSGRRLALPRLEGPTFVSWTLGVACLATGYLLALDPLAALGLLGLSAGALMLLANVLRTARVPGRPLGLAAGLVLGGQLCLGTGLPLASSLAPLDPSQPFTGGVRGALAALLVAGWVGMTVAGSLLHLLPVAIPRQSAPLPWPLRRASAQRRIPMVAVFGVALLAMAQIAGSPPVASAAAMVLGACVLVLGAAILRLAVPQRHQDDVGQKLHVIGDQ